MRPGRHPVAVDDPRVPQDSRGPARRLGAQTPPRDELVHFLLVAVVAQRVLERELGSRGVAGLNAAEEPRDVLRRLPGVDHLERVRERGPGRGLGIDAVDGEEAEGRGGEQHGGDDAGRLLAVGLELVVAVDVIGAEAEPQRRIELLGEVDAAALAAGRAVRDDPVLVRPAAADVVSGAIVPAVDAQRVLQQPAGLKNAILVVVAGDGIARGVGGVEVHRQAPGHTFGGVTALPGELRRSRPPPLGEDLHDPVVGARAVQGRRGRAPDHLDPVDVIGVQIGEPVLDVAARAEVDQLVGAVVHDDSVHDVQRLGAGDDGAGAAQPHRDAAAARVAGVLGDLGSRHHTLEGGVYGDRRRFRHVGAVHHADAAAQHARRRGRSGARDHHGVERDRHGAQREVGNGGLLGRHLHCLAGGRKSDAARDDFVRARRHGGQQVLAVRARRHLQ